jgi:hypothetical protein
MLEQDFTTLEAERAKVEAKPGRKLAPRDPNLKPPMVSLVLPPAVVPGRDLRITARIAVPGEVKWIRLRYRHVTQYEDYQTAEMALDAKTGLYTAAIPAAFVDPKWDFMYFVEVVGENGAARMYPDLERDMPYVMVAVKR